jgi:hypothetical protein
MLVCLPPLRQDRARRKQSNNPSVSRTGWPLSPVRTISGGNFYLSPTGPAPMINSNWLCDFAGEISIRRSFTE